MPYKYCQNGQHTFGPYLGRRFFFVLNNTIKRATQKQKYSAYFKKQNGFGAHAFYVQICRGPMGPHCFGIRRTCVKKGAMEWVGVESWSGMEWSLVEWNYFK